MTHPFIAIEGPIGVGKTTIAHHLAELLRAQFLPDTETRNPYLKQFYLDPKAVALHAQLHFLVARREVLKQRDIEQPVKPIVADFMIDKDRLFAELTLDENEWWMYENLYDRMVEDTRRPTLVIYLQAPLERLIERIETRGLRHEQRIDSTYLAELGSRYERFFHDYDESSLLIVNTEEVNLASDRSAVQALAKMVKTRLEEGDGGRHFWNPAG